MHSLLIFVLFLKLATVALQVSVQQHIKITICDLFDLDFSYVTMASYARVFQLSYTILINKREFLIYYNISDRWNDAYVLYCPIRNYFNAIGILVFAVWPYVGLISYSSYSSSSYIISLFPQLMILLRL